MTAPRLGNCRKCGKLFLCFRDICDECYQKQEDDFLRVAAYLREHSGSTIQEVSEATEVSIKQIREFILGRRILLTELPNLGYPCEACGEMIRTGTKCSSCLETLHQIAQHVDNGQVQQKENERKTYLKVTSFKL